MNSIDSIFQMYCVYHSNIGKAMQISWTANLDKNLIKIKPYLVRHSHEDEAYWLEELKKITPSNDLDGFVANSFIMADKEIAKVNKDIDLRIVFFNQSIVMFITGMEVFLRDSFVFLIDNVPELNKKVKTSNKRTSFGELKKYESGEITLGEIIARNYNFQNLESIRQAFTWLTNDDVFTFLKSQKKYTLLKTLESTIHRRHKIIHESWLDPKITYDEIKEIHNEFERVGTLLFIFLLRVCESNSKHN